MTAIDIITVISVLVGIVVGAITIYIALRKRSLLAPKIYIDFGLSSQIREKLPKKNRKKSIALVVIGVPEPVQEEKIIFAIPCIVENNCPHPLKKVTLQFEYPFGFDSPSPSEVAEIFVDQIRLIHTDEFVNPIAVQGYLQTRRNFDVVRPGEHLGLGEPVKVKPFSAAVAKNMHIGSHIRMLSELLKDREPIVSVCPLGLFVYSEDIPKIQKNVTIMWVKSNSLNELVENFERISKRMWKNAFGDKKWIIRHPWEKLYSCHLSVLIQPDYLVSASGDTRLMDANFSSDQMIVCEAQLPHQPPFSDLHQF